MNYKDINEGGAHVKFYQFVHSIIGLVFICLLSACSMLSTDLSPSERPIEQPLPEENTEMDLPEQPLVPLNISERSFEKIYGWLDDQTIIYTYTQAENYLISSYNLYNGKSEVLFRSEAPITNILIHNQLKKLFIHTSPYAHMATVYFIDLEGNIEYSTDIESYELAYEWNENDPAQMLITAFYEDWSYKVQHINVDAKMINDVEDVQPFVKWLNQEEVIEQDWVEEGTDFFAPLMKKAIATTKLAEKIVDDVFRFDVFSDQTMVITVPEDQPEVLKYYFYDSSFKDKQPDLTVPNLTQYTDWLIPEYEYNAKNNEFLTFIPKTHGSADIYNEGFELISLQLDDHEQKTIASNMENKPLSCSPEGKLCLYGYQLEQIINIETVERTMLIQ